MSRGAIVKVIESGIEGKIIQKGNNGMVRLDITKGFNAFGRTVYHESELEVIGGV